MNKGDALKSLGKAFDMPIQDSFMFEDPNFHLPKSLFKFIKDNFSALTVIYNDEKLMRRFLSFPYCAFVVSFKNDSEGPTMDQLSEAIIKLREGTGFDFEFVAIEKKREKGDTKTFNSLNCHGVILNTHDIRIDGEKVSDPQYVRNLLSAAEEFTRKNFEAYGLIMIFPTAAIATKHDNSNSWLVLLALVTGMMERLAEILGLTCFVIGVSDIEADNSAVPKVLRMIKDEK